MHVCMGIIRLMQVRELARLGELPTADKAESMGICFVGKRNFGSFISQYLDDGPGNFVNPEGEVVGQHKVSGGRGDVTR
jgi:tRNA U34 2-thiouridine synthase MnmA/TrmU